MWWWWCEYNDKTAAAAVNVYAPHRLACLPADPPNPSLYTYTSLAHKGIFWRSSTDHKQLYKTNRQAAWEAAVH